MGEVEPDGRLTAEYSGRRNPEEDVAKVGEGGVIGGGGVAMVAVMRWEREHVDHASEEAWECDQAS